MKQSKSDLSKVRMGRRTFLRRSVAGAAAITGFPMIVPASAVGAGTEVPPSERITMGCIGLGGRGGSNMSAFLGLPDVQVVAVCDVDKAHREAACQGVNARYKNEDCKSYNDFREIIYRDDIDTVCISTPDHWHAVMVNMAARAGKDIFCEKPISLTVADGQNMCRVVREYGRVLQTGTWRRSRPMCRLACEMIRNGRIGELKVIHIGLPIGYMIQGGKQEDLEKLQPVPEGLDYDLWLGPAPWAPYAPGRCHFNFRWIMDYSEGYISDWGAHYYDIGQWGNGTDLTGPISIEATGKFPRTGLYDAPIEHEITFTYKNGVKMVSTATADTTKWGMRFEGTEGELYVESDFIRSNPESISKSQIKPDEIRLYTSDDHPRNFIECVKTRGETAAPIEIAHRSASICHIASISLLLGRSLKWDPDTERFPDDEDANRMLSRAARAPWRV
ncbi:MAG: Gfo/Idh/MocA family oxidoreductase [Candidatus Hydrogenedentes bacterium]|nr:Gfo/Idh/MocA family oxidoreductase [Candidatus Hydrogenedentota bacterium]